jgi:hypothetical protein
MDGKGRALNNVWIDLHQVVDFFEVDDISLLLQLIPDVLVSIAAELLL